MKLSCQRICDDPKNKDDWKIYPAPPPASWPLPPPDELAKLRQKEKEREADPVAAVGSDFIFEECEIPGKHDVSDINKNGYLFIYLFIFVHLFTYLFILVRFWCK